MSKGDLELIRKKWMKLKGYFRAGDYRSQYFQNDDLSFYFLKIKDKKGGANKKLGDKRVTSLSHWFKKPYVQRIILDKR